jgi:DNA-binding MarR family transcriptional regulator/N-acetylglutamate synthase-like GNAT family acetyltransferase
MALDWDVDAPQEAAMSEPDAAAPERIAAVRAFSRFYTRRLGTLAEGLLDTPYSLTESRVLFELALAERTDMADLRRRLDLDSGYLSRLLAKFDAAGLVRREVSPLDGRRQTIALTAAGRRVFKTLDARSTKQVGEMLAALPEERQAALVAAMKLVMQALGGPQRVPVVVLRALRPGDLGWAVQRHGELYAREHGFDQGFEALVARIAADYVDRFDGTGESAWIAELDGERAGCVLCVRKDAGTAQLRILLVEPWARGHGIGARLVDECVRFARSAGYRRIALWTNDVLASARRIYEAAGFELVKEEPHRSFGKDLVGQFWERAL